MIRESGLLNYILKIKDAQELNEHPHVGRLFENFISEEVVRGLESSMLTNWDYWYYRTKNKAEIDLIIEAPYGPLPIEIKYGIKVDTRKLIAPNIIQIPAHFW